MYRKKKIPTPIKMVKQNASTITNVTSDFMCDKYSYNIISK